MKKLSHLDESGRVRMVDVGEKPLTDRVASAEALLVVPAPMRKALEEGRSTKGNLYETARIAGIQAAKRTSELIPLCHVVPLDHVSVEFTPDPKGIRITSRARTRAATGVEMEALVAASVAGLTLYDMLKALGHDMTLGEVRLLAKSGGRSGDYEAPSGGPSVSRRRAGRKETKT